MTEKIAALTGQKADIHKEVAVLSQVWVAQKKPRRIEVLLTDETR